MNHPKVWSNPAGTPSPKQGYSLAATGQRLSDTQAAILGSGEFPGYGLFDLSFHYGLPIWLSLNPWVKAELYNVFSNDTAIRWDTSVVPDVDGPVDELGLRDQLRGGRFGQST